MSLSNEAVAVMLRRSDGTQDLVPISSASGSADGDSEKEVVVEQTEDSEAQYVMMNDDNAQQHYTITSDDSTTHMVLSKELQNLVDVEYSGDQENATVYVEVPSEYQGEEVVMVGDQPDVISGRGNAQVEVRHHMDYNDGAWSGLATLMEAAQAQEASGSKDPQSTDIQIAIRGGTQDEVAPEDVEVEIVQHPDIGNEVEITNTNHKTAAQLTARIQNVLAQQGSIPLIPQFEAFPAGADPGVDGGGDSDDSDYDNSDDDSSSSTDTEDETDGRRRGRKRKGRKIYFPRVKARKRSASDERKYKKRKFDPGPTMILQEEVSPFTDRGQKKILQEINQAIKDAEMDDNAVPVLQLDETVDGQQIHQVAKKSTIYKCTKCPKFFEQRVAFKNHFISHSKVPGGHMSIRRYKCAICDFEKIHERWVNSHKKYHAGLCPFMCTECGCAFNAPYRLVSHHRKFHPGLFVYTCEKCMMKFRSQHEVNSHKMTYHQPARKRYVCVQCGARFMEQKNLIEHRVSHHKDYECLLCPTKKYKSIEELETHMAEEHSEEKLQEVIEAEKFKKKIKQESNRTETDVAVRSIQIGEVQTSTSEQDANLTVTSVIEDEVSASEGNQATVSEVVTGKDIIVTQTTESSAKIVTTPAVVRTPKELLVMTSRRSTMRKQYSPQAITEGMELFHSGYSIRGAAKVVGVPEATLRKKLKEYNQTDEGTSQLVFEKAPQFAEGTPKVVQVTSKTSKDSQQIIIGRKNLIVNEQKRTTQRIVVSSKPDQEETAQSVQIVPVQPHSKTTDVDTDQGYTIVIMGEENSQAMVENDEELKEMMKIVNVENSSSTMKKSVETKEVCSSGSKQHTPPKQSSPAAKRVSTDTSIEFSPRRSSRARRATEKGKNIFDIFESKDTPDARSPARDKANEKTETSPIAEELVMKTRAKSERKSEETMDAEKIAQKCPAAKEVVVELRNRRGMATMEKPEVESTRGGGQKETVELETIGRHTRSKLKVVTKKVEIKQVDENENKKVKEKKENLDTRKNKKEAEEQQNEKVGSNLRVTRSGRKIESTTVKEEQERSEEEVSSEVNLCVNCGQASYSKEESEKHDKECSMSIIEIPKTPERPSLTTSTRQSARSRGQKPTEAKPENDEDAVDEELAYTEFSGEVAKRTKQDNVLFGLPDGSFVMVGETTASDLDLIFSKEITIYQCGLCCAEFSSKPQLQEHVSEAHDEEENQNTTQEITSTTCKRCFVTFSSRAELVKHGSEKHKEFWCERCNRTSSSEALYKIHMMWHEKKEEGGKTLFQRGVKCVIKRGKPTATAALPGVPLVVGDGHPEGLQAWANMASIGHENPIQIKVIGRKCPECDQEFETVSMLKRHYFRTHEKDLSKWPYQCTVCSKAFATISELRKHSTVHVDDKPFQCRHCKKFFKREDHMKRHIQYKHENVKIFMCEECARPFIREDYLRNHMKTHKRKNEPPDVEKIVSAGLFKCPVCGMFCPTADKLKIHQATHTDPVLGCDQCDQRFNSQYNLKLHYKMYHQGVQYKCQYCEKAFATQNSRLAHEREVHRGRAKCYKCRHCGKMCTKSRIKRHELAHRHQYKCPHPGCERIFKMKKGCEEHYIREHSGEKCFVCEICDKNFLNNQHLMRHKEGHKKINRWKRRNTTYKPKFTEEKTEVEQLQVEETLLYQSPVEQLQVEETILYQCPVESCEMLFHTQQMMEQHFMQTHTGEGPEVEPGQNAHVSAAEVLAAMQQN